LQISEEDADVHGIVNSWISSQPEENRSLLTSLIEEYLFKGLSIIKNVQEPVVNIPQVSVVKNALSLMSQVKSKLHMAEALIRGLGGHLYLAQLINVANEVNNMLFELNY
jgi:hypothetical protein